MIFKQEQKNVLQVMLYEDESKCIVVSKIGQVRGALFAAECNNWLVHLEDFHKKNVSH